ncbi:MAG: hypothetical protein ACFCUM_13375 [Bacteroidales bacterium]
MRKLLIVCLVIVCSGGFLYPQSNISVLDENLIRENRISGITEWNHAFRGDKPVETGTISLNTRYDQNGHLQEEVTYNSKGQESRKITSRFDHMGNRTEYRIFDSRNNKLTFSQIASYDQNGNTLTESGFDGLGNYRNDYIRMDDGRLGEIRYNTQGRLKEKRTFKYSGNGTYISVFLPDNSVSQKITLLHNNVGNLLEEIYYDGKGNLIRKVEYDYNSIGLKNEERRYQGAELQYRNTYIYDGKLLLKVIRTDNSGNEVIINRYAYNENGQLIKEEWYNESAADYSTKKLSWDSNGNMTSVACYYASYQFHVFYRYDYSFF